MDEAQKPVTARRRGLLPMAIVVGAALLWVALSRAFIPVPSAEECVTPQTTGVVIGVQAALGLVALGVTLTAARFRRAGREWAWTACGVQLVCYAALGLFEYATYGGFCRPSM